MILYELLKHYRVEKWFKSKIWYRAIIRYIECCIVSSEESILRHVQKFSSVPFRFVPKPMLFDYTSLRGTTKDPNHGLKAWWHMRLLSHQVSWTQLWVCPCIWVCDKQDFHSNPFDTAQATGCKLPPIPEITGEKHSRYSYLKTWHRKHSVLCDGHGFKVMSRVLTKRFTI